MAATTRAAPRSAPARHSTGGWRKWLTLLNLMLAAVPVAVGLKLAGAQDVWLFVGAGLGIVPLAGLIGRATEVLAARAGTGVGGLLNATFGNAAELVIALVILSRGPDLYPIVKATLTGSIIGNLLLVLGAAIAVGGFRYRNQKFNRTAAGVGTTLLAIAAAGLLIPTLLYHLPFAAAGPSPTDPRRVENLSEEIAVVLIAVYAASLLFTLRTHSYLFAGNHDDPRKSEEQKRAAAEVHWGVRTAVLVLLGATAGVAVLSEWLVSAIEPAAHALGMNDIFIGIIVVAIVGNAAEHSTAVLMAWRNKADLSVQIAVGSSTQVALFVAPVLVFASLLMGHAHPLDLRFTPLEVAAVALSVALVALVAHDGESNWLEGVMLLALYAILGLAFYNLPTA